MDWDRTALTMTFTYAEAMALKRLGGKDWLHEQMLRSERMALTYGEIELGRRLSAWLASRAEVATHHIDGVTSHDAYASFSDWWKDGGLGPPPRHRMFGVAINRHIHALGLQRKRTSGGYVLVGLRIKPVAPAEQPDANPAA